MSEAARERKERRIASPEQLHDYIHVTGPNLWILLMMIIILLTGLIVLASTITIENTLPVQVAVAGGPKEGIPSVLACSITDDRRGQVKIGMPVRIAGEKATVTSLYEDEEEDFVSMTLNRPGAALKEGVYDAEIVLEETTPITFLLERE